MINCDEMTGSQFLVAKLHNPTLIETEEILSFYHKYEVGGHFLYVFEISTLSAVKFNGFF